MQWTHTFPTHFRILKQAHYTSKENTEEETSQMKNSSPGQGHNPLGYESNQLVQSES